MKAKIAGLVYLILLHVWQQQSPMNHGKCRWIFAYTVNKITEKLHMEDNLKNSGKKILKQSHFSLYEGYTESVNELKELKAKSENTIPMLTVLPRHLLELFYWSSWFISYPVSKLYCSVWFFLSITSLGGRLVLTDTWNHCVSDIPVLVILFFNMNPKALFLPLYKIMDKATIRHSRNHFVIYGCYTNH